MKPELFKDAPKSTVPVISDGGFINSELFFLMAETLLKTCQTNRRRCSPPDSGQSHVALQSRSRYPLQRAPRNTAVSTSTLQ